MKKLRRLTILSSLVLLLSCQKGVLEIAPFGSVSEQTLANKIGVNGVLIGAYSLLDGVGATGGGFTSGFNYIWGPDDARQGADTGVSVMDAFSYDATLAVINSRWSLLFAAVQRCNDVLVLLPKATDLTEAEALQITAEARFLRGHYYLQLAMLWKNVPWMDETISYGAGKSVYLVPNTVNIYPKIEEDFKFAADNLTPTKADVGRANKWAAKSYLAKTYMHQKKFAEAKVVLDEIIPNGVTAGGKKYALNAKYADNFKTATRNSAETVFAVQMSVNDGANGANGNAGETGGTFGGPVQSCCGWYQPTFDLVDAFQTDPVTGLPLPDTYMNTPIPNDQGIDSTAPFTPYAGTLDPRLDWTVGRRGIPYLDWGVFPGKAWIRNQYTGGPYVSIKSAIRQANATADRQGGGNGNTPLNLVRFADVLLWAAECEVEVGSLLKAEEYVNMIRARAANPEGFVYQYLDNAKPMGGYSIAPAANYKIGLYAGQFAANGKSFARKAVRFERRLELAMEHHRHLDLRRYDGLEFDLADHHNKVMQREGARPGFNIANRYKSGVFVKGKNELFPIPQQQIDLSVAADGKSVLVQNPGW